MSSVSVVVPAFNCAAYLPAALESVRAQTYAPSEIIVVDDGSTDETPEVARLHPDVRYVRQANQGPSRARNTGIGLARGELLAFLDADDLWLPNKLAAQIEGLATCPEAAFSFSALWYFAGNDHVTAPIEPYEPRALQTWLRGRPDVHGTASGWLHDVLLGGNCIHTSSVVVRAAVVRDIGGFDESLTYGEDWDLWLRLSRRYPGVYVRRPTTRYRLHSTSLSGTGTARTERYYRANVLVLEKHQARSPSLAVRRALGRARAALAQTLLTAGRRHAARAAARHGLLTWPTPLAVRTLAEATAPGAYRALSAAVRRGSRATN